MLLIPAIDIRDGRCVRLLQGDFERETRYDADPVELAARYRRLGASWLHVVDLDGAAAGAPANLPLIAAMRADGLRVQLGGGIRDEASLKQALDIADRVVIGSLAVGEPERVQRWLADLGPERITLGFDVRLDDAGIPFVTTHGWTRGTDLTLADAVERYTAHGL
ncbi:MAG: 1-(5-phosphoribosyl)-5-((5-phosphoribosylamino)methylideneamino)imidazole-4-carboxamide isomerase, partial [Gammaproteobacteria bacterium]|nr:1-(5-phosphoribosyl)-5-((5-phosphoribosylamino)methylideneamino)imidazole-4-carboxamide isomerase [Gammaproteobacteria bacterium]